MNVQQPAAPTELSRHLHDFPRVDGRFKHVNNTLPSFTDGWGDGDDNDSYEHRYVESLLMAVAVPVALVVFYWFIEYLVRAVVHFCSCCNKRPAAPAGAAKGRDRLHKTRCFGIFAVITTLFVAGCAVAALVRAGELADPARDLRNAVTGISDRIEGFARDGSVAVDGARRVNDAAESLLLGTREQMPDDVRRTVLEIAQQSRSAGRSLDTFVGTVESISFAKGARDYAKWSDQAYGSWGYTTSATCLAGVVLLYALTESLITSRRRGLAAQCFLVFFDLVAFACLIGLMAVAFVQLGGMLAVSDACDDPLPTADRLFSAHLDSDGDAPATARYFVHCDGAHPNPLNGSIAEAQARVADARSDFDRVVAAWAREERNATVTAMVNRLGDDLVNVDDALPQLADDTQCADLHNEFVGGLNAACDPMTESSVRLLSTQATLAFLVLVLRCLTVYRCCRCCYRTDVEACGEDDMRLGLLGGSPPQQQQQQQPNAPLLGGGAVHGHDSHNPGYTQYGGTSSRH